MMVRDDLDALLQVMLVSGLLHLYAGATRNMLTQTLSNELRKPVSCAAKQLLPSSF